MRSPLTILNLDDDPVPVPEPTRAAPPATPAPVPEPERARSIWDDRLFDPVGGKIHLDEPVMLLRAEDPAAAEIAELWAERVQGFAPAQAAEARATAARMRAWRMRHNAIVH